MLFILLKLTIAFAYLIVYNNIKPLRLIIVTETVYRCNIKGTGTNIFRYPICG